MKRFTCHIGLSSDEKYYFISSSEHTTSEVYFIDRYDDNLKVNLFLKEKRSVFYK